MKHHVLNRIFARWVILRSVGIWLVLRIAYAGLVALHLGPPGAGAGGARLLGTPDVAVQIALLTVILTLLETRRRNELLLFGNLGVSPMVVVGTAMIPPLVFEAVLAAMR